MKILVVRRTMSVPQRQIQAVSSIEDFLNRKVLLDRLAVCPCHVFIELDFIRNTSLTYEK